MSKLILHDPSISREDILKLREERFLSASVASKLDQLFKLIRLSVKLNGGAPLKIPQGKGIIISKHTL